MIRYSMLDQPAEMVEDEEGEWVRYAALSQQAPYPEGDVVGPCVCGSWPGGPCLKCKWIPQQQAEPVGIIHEWKGSRWLVVPICPPGGTLPKVGDRLYATPPAVQQAEPIGFVMGYNISNAMHHDLTLDIKRYSRHGYKPQMGQDIYTAPPADDEAKALKHDIERHLQITSELATENDEAVRLLRVASKALNNSPIKDAIDAYLAKEKS